MSQFDLEPETYMATIRAELPRYDELQDAVADATRGPAVTRMLELGVGTGETAEHLLAVHPSARLTAIDGNEGMLERARRRLPAGRVDELRLAQLEDALPAGPFDLVVSALVVHHLDSAAKRDLFHRIARVLVPSGSFVLGDVFVPDDPKDAVTPLEPGVDLPDRLADVLDALREAGFDPELRWSWKDVAVVAARRV